MNTKNRALLWEETRVGGAIALMTLIGGLMGMLPFLDSYHQVTDEILILFPTLGFSLLAALLLTLNTANSGHLMGGFSRRILRLPIEIWSTVLIILLSRLSAVLVVSGLLAAVSWGLFGSGPGADTVLLLGMAYLLFQVLDWLRAPAAPLVVMIITALLLVLLMHVSGFKPVPGSMLEASHLLLAFPLIVGLAYAVSLVAVGYTRRGAKLAFPARLTPKAKDDVHAGKTGKHRKPFATAAAAQYWFERRHVGILLPIATVICWMLCAGGYILVRPTAASREPYMQSMFLLQVAPFLAFVGAAIVWHLRVDRTQFWRRSRPASYFLRLPVEPVDLVRARIAISALTFIAVWLIASLVVRFTFLSSIVRDLLQSAMANGEITGREVTAFVISLPLLLGLLGWIAAHVPWKLVALEFLLGFTMSAFHELHMLRFTLYPLGVLMVALPLAWFGAQLGRAWRKGLLPGWSLFACLLLWMAVGYAIFPYGFLNQGPHPAIMCLATASIAALVVLPFPKLLLAAPGHLVGERTGKIFAARPGSGFTLIRGVGLVLLLAIFVGIGWLRSTPEPTAKARLRAEGTPTTFAELDASYPAVPPEANLALRYEATGTKLDALREEWSAYRERQRPSLAQSGKDAFDHLIALNEKRNSSRKRPAPGSSDTLSDPLSVGYMLRDNTSIVISSEVWAVTLDYWQRVGKPITDELHAHAQSGLKQSRYPFDAAAGFYSPNIHLPGLTELTYHLRQKALIAAIEGQPEDVAEALSDAQVMAESVKGLPSARAQSTRENIYLNMEKLLEDAMNRRVFADEDLQRFQSIFHGAFPTEADSDMIAPIANEALVLSFTQMETYMYSGLVFGDRWEVAETPLGSLLEGGLAPALDLLGWTPASYLIATRSHFLLKEQMREQRQRGYASKKDYSEPLWAYGALFPSSWPYMHTLPGSIFDLEWQIRAHLIVAETAAAVERYRLANGRLPENLEQLVPNFIELVPSDPYNDGKPLAYRIQDGGGYQVYSFGANCEDDWGSTDRKDITFTVNPVELRVRPQIQPDATV